MADFPEELFNNEHNNEVGRKLFRMYKQNRILEEKENERQRELMMMSAPPRAALRELKRESRKPFTLRSIYNFRYLERKKALSGKTEIDAFVEYLDAYAVKYPGLMYKSSLQTERNCHVKRHADWRDFFIYSFN